MATPVAGNVTSYELTAGLKLNFDELIYMLSPMDLPMTLGVDAQDTMVVAKDSVDQTTFSWQDEEILTPRVLVAAAATTGDTAITVQTNEGRRFSTGDIVRVLTTGVTTVELAKVTAIATSAVTLARGYQSTTAASIASGAVLIGVGKALAEGSDPENFRSRDRDVRSNYTEIFGPHLIQMSATEQVVSKYGVSDEWSKQVFNRMREIYISIEQALLYGVAFNDAGNKMRGTGGLSHFISTNHDSTSTQFNLAAITAQQQACYNLGLVPSVAVANPISLNDLNDTDNTSRVRVTFDDGRRGRRRIETLDTEYGTLTIMRNRWVWAQNAFLVTPQGITRRILRPMQYEVLAKTGDSDKGMLVAEEGFQVKGQQHMARFSKLTTYTGV